MPSLPPAIELVVNRTGEGPPLIALLLTTVIQVYR